MALPSGRQDREYKKFVEDAAGNVAIRTVLTDGSGSDLAVAEDAAHTTGDAGIQALTVRQDSPAALGGTDGDYQPMISDDEGYTYVVPKGYDSSSDATKVFETSPIWNQHSEETLADVTNETSGTNYYYVDMDGYNALSIQADTGGTAPTDTVTITFEATNQDDGTAAASCFYTDVTKMAYDAATNALGTASWVDTDMMAFFTPAVAGAFKYIRVKTVTAGGSNDQDYTIYAKKAFI